jgi:hypothetical protein
MAGINLHPDLAITLTERYRDVHIERGVVDSLPQTTDVFSRVAGIEGAQIVGHRLPLVYMIPAITNAHRQKGPM